MQGFSKTVQLFGRDEALNKLPIQTKRLFLFYMHAHVMHNAYLIYSIKLLLKDHPIELILIENSVEYHSCISQIINALH